MTSQLPPDGLVRLKSILRPSGPLPISASSWWAGVKTGRFPRGHKLGPRTTVWRAADIAKLVEAGTSAPLLEDRSTKTASGHDADTEKLIDTLSK